MLLSLLMLAALVMGACTDDTAGGNTGTAEDPVAVQVQVSGEAEEVAVYRTLATAFERSNPDVKIQLIEVAEKDDHLQKLTSDFATGSPPDVFLVNFREYSQFVVRGAVEPLSPHLEDLGIDLADYYEPPIEAFTYEEQLQCMPQNISSLVVYYNKKLFKKAGLARPPDDWSWADFREYALAHTGDDVRGLGIEPNIIRVAPFVWSNGGEIVDSPDAPTRFTMAEDPRAVEALQFIFDLVREDKVVPTEQEVAAQDLETRFVTSKLGMLLSSRRDTPVFREVRGLSWDVAPLPVAEQPSGILHSDAYCVAKGTEELDAALRFVAFAGGQEGETVTALAGRTVPSLKGVAEGGAFLNPIEPPGHPRVFLDAIPVLRRTPVLPTWPEIEDIAEEILTRAFYEDGYTVERALQEIDEQTRDLFAEGAP